MVGLASHYATCKVCVKVLTNISFQEERCKVFATTNSSLTSQVQVPPLSI
jgi:hypothetical protein